MKALARSPQYTKKQVACQLSFAADAADAAKDKESLGSTGYGRHADARSTRFSSDAPGEESCAVRIGELQLARTLSATAQEGFWKKLTAMRQRRATTFAKHVFDFSVSIQPHPAD